MHFLLLLQNQNQNLNTLSMLAAEICGKDMQISLLAFQFIFSSSLIFFLAKPIKIIEAAPGYKRITISICHQSTRNTAKRKEDLWLVGLCLSMFKAVANGCVSVCRWVCVCVWLAYDVVFDTLFFFWATRGCILGLSSDFYLLHKSTRCYCNSDKGYSLRFCL